ncbi:MAG: hypothetical protein LBR78_01115 [Holosporales bacterium]|jgi:hypothetical protein|nr:hypothetical protein [Holosporales bacterium]
MKVSKLLLASVALATATAGVNQAGAACPVSGFTVFLQGTLLRNKVQIKGLKDVSDLHGEDMPSKFNKMTGLVALGFGWSIRYGDACIMPWLEFGVGIGKAKRQYSFVDNTNSTNVTKITLRRTFQARFGTDLCWLVTPQFGVGVTVAVGLTKYTGKLYQTDGAPAPNTEEYDTKLKKNKMRFGVVAGPVIKFYPIPDVSIFAKGLFTLNKQKCGEIPVRDGYAAGTACPIKCSAWEIVLGVSKVF